MAISVTNIGTNTNTSGSTLALSSVTVPAGALVCLAVQEISNSVPAGSVTDTPGNSYSAATGGNPNGNTANGFCRLFYSANVAALSSQTITYNKNGTAKCAISAFYATGISSSPLDTSVTNTATGSSGSPSVTSGTPSQAGDLMVAILGIGGAGGGGITFTQDSGNGWAAPITSSQVASPSGGSVLGGNQVNAGTGTKAFSPGISPSAAWFTAVVGFKAAPAGNVTLTADTVSFSETGNASLFSTSQASSAGSFSETGVAALFKIAQPSNVAAFTETGNAALFKIAQPSSAAAYAETGNAALFNVSELAVVGAFSETGIAALFTLNMPSAATSYAVTGNAAAFFAKIAAASTSYAVTGNAALFDLLIPSVTGSYAVTGYAANELTLEAAGSASYVVTAIDADLRRTGPDFETGYQGIGHYLEEMERARQLAAITRKTPGAPIDRRTAPRFLAPPAPPMAPAVPPVDMAAIAAQRTAAAQAATQRRRRDEEALLLLAC